MKEKCDKAHKKAPTSYSLPSLDEYEVSVMLKCLQGEPQNRITYWHDPVTVYVGETTSPTASCTLPWQLCQSMILLQRPYDVCWTETFSNLIYTDFPSFISDVFLPESWLITQDEFLCSFGTQLDSLIIIAVSLTRKLFLSLAAHRCKTSACVSSITASGPLRPLKVIKSSEVIILKCKLIYSSFKHAIQGSCPLNILWSEYNKCYK